MTAPRQDVAIRPVPRRTSTPAAHRLLAEEDDPVAKRHLVDFPQAFSHLALINTAHGLATSDGPAQQRAAGSAGKTSAAAGPVSA